MKCESDIRNTSSRTKLVLNHGEEWKTLPTWARLWEEEIRRSQPARIESMEQW
jgi:hypothetical protein